MQIPVPIRGRALAALIVGSAACSGDGGSLPSPGASDTPTVTTMTSVTTTVAGGDVFSEGSTRSRPIGSDAAVVEVVEVVESSPENDEPVVESLAAVPETGVPGIASDDAFCRSWSVYSGSFQALDLAWFVQEPDDAARLEVAASSALAEAAAGMGENLPAELEEDRDALTVVFPAPLVRRSERAAEFLADAGLDDAAIDSLGDAWIAAITAAGLDSVDLSIDVPEGAAASLETAATRFASELPPIPEDPTLDTTDIDISPLITYVRDNCPDQGTLAGNDVVGD